ncbi:MAG TPA: hypothetical protein PKY30_08420 [Myxococcota bacterium]|nr:hypothetical protein [Myxococcota bacterium]HND29766.1 hypothetical protein [Myxococcota bacterium]HNH47048.1 hypothetical protein [Myxococcota bacterium]
MLLLLACTGGPESSVADDSAEEIPSAYEVHWSTAPDPLVAGQEGTFSLQVTDQDGRPIDDLQQSHQRMIHAIFISSDLEDFQHLHQEDYGDITADNLRTASFSFPITPALAADYHIAFDYAHRNQYQHTESVLTAVGAPAPLESPRLEEVSVAEDRGLRAELSWEVPPSVGYEASWSVHITEVESGEEVTDLVQWLGADAHAVTTDAALNAIGHTHAWFPGMDNAPPGHDMPHQYPGPDIPFHYSFDIAGSQKVWVQLAREGAPDEPYLFPFVFTVAP